MIYCRCLCAPTIGTTAKRRACFPPFLDSQSVFAQFGSPSHLPQQLGMFTTLGLPVTAVEFCLIHSIARTRLSQLRLSHYFFRAPFAPLLSCQETRAPHDGHITPLARRPITAFQFSVAEKSTWVGLRNAAFATGFIHPTILTKSARMVHAEKGRPHMPKPTITYHFRGNIERSVGQRYQWREGWSENNAEGLALYPWLTMRECQTEARKANARAVFVRGKSTHKEADPCQP